MARPELGTKHVCPECGKKFYDLNRDPALCPGCGFVIETENETPDETAFSAGSAPVSKESDSNPPESGDDYDDDEAGVIDSDTDLADLSDDDDVPEVEDDDDDVLPDIGITKPADKEDS
ncbi:MAG: TIGR02300 family protein [Hyphomicrobiales bacterium]|nr:MAG: TIGR02300 family protein [Hyphomicrobiales bacterium]